MTNNNCINTHNIAKTFLKISGAISLSGNTVRVSMPHTRPGDGSLLLCKLQMTKYRAQNPEQGW
jgi:hypothetical protein